MTQLNDTTHDELAKLRAANKSQATHLIHLKNNIRQLVKEHVAVVRTHKAQIRSLRGNVQLLVKEQAAASKARDARAYFLQANIRQIIKETGVTVKGLKARIALLGGEPLNCRA